MNATRGWKDNTHYPCNPHKRACTLTYMHTEENTCPHTYYHCTGVYFYLDAKSMWNAWWVMMMWRFEAASWMEDPIWLSPSVSLPCYASDFHSERERERKTESKRERGSPKTMLQLKLSGVNSAIITLKCQTAIKYNSSSGRKQISFDHAVITLSCRTIRRDQIFTFSVWGKAIRVHSTWQGCTFAILQG